MKGYNKHIMMTLGALATVMMGCTKERPYESAGIKDPQTFSSKSLITEAGKGSVPAGEKYADDLYVYLPSTLNTTRTQSASIPHFMGDAKVVRMVFERDALKLYEVDREERFGENDLNHSPVLTIPVRHVDYRCSPDADGKCTNREEEDNTKLWNEKRNFEIKVDQLRVDEFQFFPENFENIFFPCLKELDQKVVKFNLEQDTMNITVEKTYQTNLLCAGDLESASDLTFRARYQYSMIKLNKLDDANYQPLKYAKGEENTFGFFTTRVVKLNPDNTNSEDSETKFVNRWAPGKNVVYHMSQSFNRRHNARLKEATVQAVNTINASLAKAGATIKIDLREPDQNVDEGDIRTNMIVLEDDPVAARLLGYGPTATNPLTGEILTGRTVMYAGTIRTTIKEAYDELVIEKMLEATKSGGAKTAPAVGSPSKIVAIAQSGHNSGEAKHLSFGDVMKKKVAAVTALRNKDEIEALAKIAPKDSSHAFHNHDEIKQPVNLGKLEKIARNNKLLSKSTKDPKAKLQDIYSKHCMFTADLFNFHQAIEADVDALIKKMGSKMWDDLTVAQQEEVLDILMPFVWTPTLVHELGHNLGLRHNFGGSEDKDNFYTEAELKQMGITRQFKYSSVMDYGYRSNNELRIMGKYDIAALRFGYAEKVELKDRSLVTLAKFRSTPGLELHPYNFCTDEHAGINPNCARFDEGTTLTEMVQHHINAYKEKYYKRNFRNGRLSFSLMHDMRYTGSVELQMDGMRAAFERYEMIKKNFGLADTAPEWESIEFLKDLKTAVTMGAGFLADVVRTPDISCAIVAKANPGQIIAILPLKALSTRAITCFDKENVGLNDAYAIVAQGGKSFQSMKDPNSSNNYLDQIDVRGIWMDKLLALSALTTRDTGITSFDEFRDNMLDIEQLAGPIREAIEQVVADEIVTNIQLVTEQGQVLEGQIATQFYDAREAQNGHLLQKPLSESAQQYYGIHAHMPFQERVVSMLKAKLPSREQELDPSSLLNGLEVIKLGVSDTQVRPEYVTVEIGKDVFAAHKASSLALNAVASLNITQLLGSFDAKKLAEIVANVKAGKPAPANATEEEKAAYTLPAEVLEKFQAGGFQVPIYYAEMIKTMAK
jgi:hypothetical protein